MLSPAERVRLLIGGQVHEDWESYELDSDLLVPADGWQLSVGLPLGGPVPAELSAGATIELAIGDDTVLSGRIDEVSLRVARGEHALTLSGRDGAAVLVDCSAPVFVAKLATLEQIVAKVVRPLGLTKIRIDADATRTREKVNVEPGDSAWDVLARVSEANGLWPWFEPDGTLVIGGPDYSKPPVAELILRFDGAENNVLSVEETRSIAERYSVVTVLGQAHGTITESGKNAEKASWTDEEMAAIQYRPKIVTDHECETQALARDRARKLLSDSRLKGRTIRARVLGHRIVAPGKPGDGLLWTPGQRLTLLSEPHGIDATFFLIGRRFSLGMHYGGVTELTLKEDGAWVLDAHPSKRRHRLGKNGLPDDFKEQAP
ncbi:phage baseplate assembly protein [Accumulibacter sp.]|uniref:phage baseplate assembly protein n=1 Tax=Accumulibacter sp. TaxID=2053492 RepID=UPI0025F5C07D|nr:phage tail protein [Accumulibacter sp.]MCM8595128.1 phage tail protein [Accumulibacter sp.]MCM8625514.1 phage tail protein [Accumulibacter sp.]MDS4049274.1 phage tail protein [Accumulibacter sp.]